MEHEGDGWLGYDRHFRQVAAAVPSTTWARIEPTLWSMAFAGKTRSTRCKYCFSLSHSEQHCELAPVQQEANVTLTRLDSGSSAMQSSRQCPICNKWNYNPSPRCRHRHICIPCSCNPSIVDKAHKAMFCPNYPVQAPTHSTIPSLLQPQPQQGSNHSQGYSLPSNGPQRFQPY